MLDETKEPHEQELDEDSDDGVDYKDANVKQDEFEQLAREEGFDKAAEDAARGKKPSKPRRGSMQPPQ